MSPKSVAFLIVGMLVISSVFFVFHVTYPDNPTTITIKNPKTPKNLTPPNYQIFNNQSLNLPRLGLNQTSFTPSGNTSLLLSGYVYNYSSGNVLANQRLGIAVMQAFTMVTTNSQGYYQVQIKVSGQGTFAFKVFQYATKLYQLYISPGTSSMSKNIYLNPLHKFSVSGLTESHGNRISGVDLSFQSFWGTYTSVSSQNGAYSVNMVDENYSILAQKSGFSTTPDPTSVGVDNASRSSFDILLNSSNQAILYMSGFVLNKLGAPVGGATVSVISPALATPSATTYADGYYNISVAYYSNLIQVSSSGYTTQSRTVQVTHNLTDENFTLTSFNPFVNGPNTGSGPGPYGMNNNSAIVNFGANLQASISGIVYNKQTGMNVSNQQFTVYTSVNGTYFYYYMGTSSNGSYRINMAYHGYYNYTIESLKFNPTWLDQNLVGNVNDITIFVTTPQSNIFYINGSLINKITGGNLANATINITGSGGQLLKQIHVGANGSYNFTLLGGNYNMTVTAPGFNSTTSPINVNQNITNQNLSLNPGTGISPGSTKWTPSNSTGIPGVNSTNIQNQVNSTINSTGQSPTTVSGTPVNLTLQFKNNNTGLAVQNTSYLMYIYVNGIYLQTKGQTNSTGMSTLYLAYGGTYILLPEMIDYSGNAVFVNTSNASSPIVLNMTPLQQYLIHVTLTNPYNYSNAQVPVNGLSVSNNYALPIYSVSDYAGSNYSLVNYSLPNGTYNFSYSDPSYVPLNFSQLLNGTSVHVNKVLTPYTLNLTWSSDAAWGFYLNSTTSGNTLASGSKTSGSGSDTYGLTAGTFKFQSMIGGTPANSKNFILSSSSASENLSLQIAINNLPLTNGSAYLPPSNGNYSAYYNYTISSLGTTAYIKQFDLNITNSNNVGITINSLKANGQSGNGVYTLSNYFVLSNTPKTAISIAVNGLTLQQFGSILNNVSMVYYEVTLG